ncbi:MAG: pyridoxamine 5'-phosphate oxidase family protein [Maricaulaceae bacterium]|jgi:predicted pyridoxine 5'-phosphate oxidase superfamily flavin-nucleotide-binding protein
MSRAFADIAFTPAVRAAQKRLGSANAYERFLAADTPANDVLGPEEAAFLTACDGFFQATVSESGWPYVQFRGGPPGFLHVLGPTRIGYADFRGNRQYVSLGNLAGDDRVALIVMDYPNRRRLKLWGRARAVEADDDPRLVHSLHVEGYRARPERAVLIDVAAFDWNCPQHIPRRFTLDEVHTELQPLHAELARLTEDNRRLRALVERADAP